MTLLEVMVSIGIMALMATLIYGAYDGMSRSRRTLSYMNERYREGRGALSRMSRELESAFVSLHQPLSLQQSVETTAFIATKSRPADRIDFNSFSHRRINRNTHESDQNELSYFGARDPDIPGKIDLVRREDKYLDLDPTKGGVINVMAEDIQSFEVSFLDPTTGLWGDTWDTTQPSAQPGRLPLQVKLSLVLNGQNGLIRLMTKAPLGLQTGLSFAVPR